MTDSAQGADYFAPQFSQVGITPEIQGTAQSPVSIAILDGLANPYHPDLAGQVSGVFGFANGTYTRFDNHGTFVAGIVAARQHNGGIVGAAPNARLYSYGVFDDNAFVHQRATSIALNDAAARGATIANMSYGVPSFGPGQPARLFNTDDLVGINQVRDRVLAVRAAGNDGAGLASWEIGADASQALKNLIIVGSVDAANNLSYFSNRPGEACFSNGGTCAEPNKLKQMTMVAPGEHWISTTAYGYARGSGTSFAAPVVAGAAGLLQSRWPHLQSDPSATRQILFESATDLGTPGVDGVYGWGLLNVTAAFAPIGTTSLMTAGGRHGVTASGLSGGTAFAAAASSGIEVSGFDKFDRDFAYRLADFVAPQRNTLSTRLTSYLDSISDNAAPVPLAVSLTDSLQATMLVPADKPAGQGTNAAFADTELSAPDWQLTFREGTSDRDFAFGHGNAVGLTQIADVAGFGVPGIGNTSAASPVLSLATGGVFAGMGQGVGEFARLSFAFQQSPDDAIGESAYDARALTFGATLEPGRDLRLGAAATYLSEDAGALGSIGSGAFSMESDEYATQSLTLSAEYVMTPDLTLSGAFTTARTTQATGASAFSLNGPVRSEAMSLGLAKTDLFAANDRLTVTVSQPLRVSKGSTTLRLGDRLDAAGNLLYRDNDVGLEPDGRQIDFQVGYETATANGVSFSAGAYFTRDDAHVKGETDAGAVASINLKF